MAVKGKTNNPNGRPKGKPNKITGEVKEWISAIIDKQRPQLEKDLKQLEPAERWRIIEKLMQYVVPKQQAVSADVKFENLSERDLDTVINQITKSLDDDTTTE